MNNGSLNYKSGFQLEEAISDCVPTKALPIISLAAIEQHGPHLPVGTDYLIAKGLLCKALEEKTDHSLFALPVMPFGASDEHADFRGTISLRFETLAAVVMDMAKSLKRQGFQKCLLMNAHGGNSALCQILVMRMRAELDLIGFTTNWMRFGFPDGIMEGHDIQLDIHGGFVETSIMLALHPELVDMSRAKPFLSRQNDYAKAYKHLRAYGPVSFGWMMKDLNPQGAAGRADLASADAGHKIITHQVGGFLELVQDIHQFDTDTMR
jgi:creatinine amidohydrolase